MAVGRHSRVDARRRRIGDALVAAQFGLLGLGLLPLGPVAGGGQLRPLGLACLGGAGVVGALGLAALGRDTRVHPVPGEQVRLRTSGAYAVIRHPMYAAVGLASLGLALSTGRVVAGAAFVALAGVLRLKAGFEDRLLQERFGAQFEQYAARVPAIVPRPWRSRAQESAQ